MCLSVFKTEQNRRQLWLKCDALIDIYDMKKTENACGCDISKFIIILELSLDTSSLVYELQTLIYEVSVEY